MTLASHRGQATKAQRQDRRDGLFRIAEADQPTGVQFIYYGAVAAGIVPKTDPGYRMVLPRLRIGPIPQRGVTELGQEHAVDERDGPGPRAVRGPGPVGGPAARQPSTDVNVYVPEATR
jgi:hypothetical protein